MVESGLNSDTSEIFKGVLVTANNKDLIKVLEGARVLTTLNINFTNTQCQLTPQSFVGFGQISNLSEMSWLFLLPAHMKKI